VWKAQIGWKWFPCEIIKENQASKVVRFLNVHDDKGNRLIVKRKNSQLIEVNDKDTQSA